MLAFIVHTVAVLYCSKHNAYDPTDYYFTRYVISLFYDGTINVIWNSCGVLSYTIFET